jgi:hypothetical protein
MFDDFWRGVADVADKITSSMTTINRQSKVQDKRFIVIVKHYVFRFYIPMVDVL